MGWNPRDAIKDHHWRVPHAWNKSVQAKEQDDAAGGRQNRVIRQAPQALGRVVLRSRYRRLYAELRWTDDTKQCSEYLGEMTERSRADNLASGWRKAHARRLAVVAPDTDATTRTPDGEDDSRARRCDGLEVGSTATRTGVTN